MSSTETNTPTPTSTSTPTETNTMSESDMMERMEELFTKLENEMKMRGYEVPKMSDKNYPLIFMENALAQLEVGCTYFYWKYNGNTNLEVTLGKFSKDRDSYVFTHNGFTQTFTEEEFQHFVDRNCLY